jgi:hypothetical protein
MSAPQGAGRSVEIRFIGYVTLQDVCAHVGEIWRRARQQQGLLFALNCAAVIDLSALALTALGRLRRHLREFGCDLALVKCSPSVLQRAGEPMVGPLLTHQMAEAEAVEEDAEEPTDGVPEGPTNRLASSLRQDAGQPPPAPKHVSLLVRDYQCYWLN